MVMPGRRSRDAGRGTPRLGLKELDNALERRADLVERRQPEGSVLNAAKLAAARLGGCTGADGELAGWSGRTQASPSGASRR